MAWDWDCRQELSCILKARHWKVIMGINYTFVYILIYFPLVKTTHYTLLYICLFRSIYFIGIYWSFLLYEPREVWYVPESWLELLMNHEKVRQLSAVEGRMNARLCARILWEKDKKSWSVTSRTVVSIRKQIHRWQLLFSAVDPTVAVKTPAGGR